MKMNRTHALEFDLAYCRQDFLYITEPKTVTHIGVVLELVLTYEQCPFNQHFVSMCVELLGGALINV